MDDHFPAGFDGEIEWEHEGHHDPLVGKVIGDKYRVLECIGIGGMGKVYKVEHEQIKKLFALKILNPRAGDQSEFYRRFAREARAAGRIDHPHVVSVTDFGHDGPLVFYVMDYLEGGDVADLLEMQERLPWHRVRRLALQLLDAVASAHAAGFVHRDLKPENLFLVAGRKKDHLMILDFGIAHALRVDDETSGITAVGAILGSPPYMSPEQCLAQPVDPRSDIYAIGVILYEMLMGRPPFMSRDDAQTLRSHIHDEPPPFSQAAPGLEVPDGVEELIMRALAKSPAKRFDSAAEFRAALKAVPAGIGRGSPLATDAHAKLWQRPDFWWGALLGAVVGSAAATAVVLGLG